MASTYSSYKIELIGTGEQSGTWGNTTNNNFQYAIEQAIGGYATQVLTTTSTSLTLSDTNALQNARALFLQFTGTPGSGATVVLPSIQKLYFIKNAITTYDLIVKTSTATTITVPNGKTACIYVNGTDVVGTQDWMPSLTTTSVTASGSATFGGNFSSGTVTTTSGTYSRSGTTVTVTSAAHGFSTGQNLYLVFTTGAATTGVYSITVVDANTFTVTDSVSGTTSGNVTINRYTNTVTFLAPVSSFGSFGTAGQVLASQGVNIPPQWTTLASVSGNWTVGGNLSVTGTSTFTGTVAFNGNTTIGSTTVTSGTYSRTTTTVTVTSNAHGFSNGQVLYLSFSAGTGGTATSGVYAISNVTTNTFDITDTASGTITGSPAVSITKYNNTATQQAPLSSFGSTGSSGYLLASQGASAPPQWVNGVSKLTNSTDKLSVDSSGNFTAVVPSGSTLLPAFLPRAWANFAPTATSTVNTSYTQNNGSGAVGTIITVTYVAHGFSAGQVVYMDFTSGTAVDAWYVIQSITSPDVFVLAGATSLNTSGAANIYKVASFGGGNVSSVICGPGTTLFNQYAVNFVTDMVDTNYAWAGSVGYNNQNQNAWLSAPRNTVTSSWKATKFLRFSAVYANVAEATVSPSDVSVIITR